VRHLSTATEILSHHLLTLHNLHPMLTIAREIQQAVLEDRFQAYREAFSPLSLAGRGSRPEVGG